jgi:hypothetical protein
MNRFNTGIKIFISTLKKKKIKIKNKNNKFSHTFRTPLSGFLSFYYLFQQDRSSSATEEISKTADRF